MPSIAYDYAIIGAGAAGLQLALAITKDPFFGDKKILLLDKSEKSFNDKTWCFWEKGSGLWDDIIHHSWHKGSLITASINKNLDLGPYQYKMLRSIDFYEYCKKELDGFTNLHWKRDDIREVFGDDPVVINGLEQSYMAQHVFDSRIDKDYYTSRDNFLRIFQHFKG